MGAHPVAAVCMPVSASGGALAEANRPKSDSNCYLYVILLGKQALNAMQRVRSLNRELQDDVRRVSVPCRQLLRPPLIRSRRLVCIFSNGVALDLSP